MSENCCFSTTELPCLADHQLEGTPFVPMALLVDQLARTLNSTNARLADIAIKMPVMLRKNRAKILLCQKENNQASLVDDAGNIYASLRSETNDTGVSPELPSKQHLTLSVDLCREQIYPTLMFHGPTFQANFKFYEFNAQTALVEIHDFAPENTSLGRYRSGQQIPIVLTDLALQVIGLHLMAFNGIYALPATCRTMYPYEHRSATTSLVRVFKNDDGSYQLSAITSTGEPILTCSGIHFQNTARPVEPEKLPLLEAIKT